MPHRVVRFTEPCFADLDSQLSDERTATDPSKSDFRLHDVPRLGDRLAQEFEANTLPAVGNEPIRVLIEHGLLVAEMALYAYLGNDDVVPVIAVELETSIGTDGE